MYEVSQSNLAFRTNYYANNFDSKAHIVIHAPLQRAVHLSGPPGKLHELTLLAFFQLIF